MIPRSLKAWLWFGALAVFVVAALVAQGLDGAAGMMPALGTVLLLVAVVAVLWGAFLANKSRERRRRG